MAGAAGLAAYLGGQGQERARQQEQARQQQAEDAHLAQQLAQNADQFTQRQTLDERRLAAEEKRDAATTAATQRSAGLDPKTGLPVAVPDTIAKALGPKSSLEQKADHAAAMADWYLTNGYPAQANDFRAQAAQLTTAAHDARLDAAKFAEIANRKLHDQAIEQRWTADRVSRERTANARTAAMIQNGQMHYAAAMASVGARYAAIGAANNRADAALGERRREFDTRQTTPSASTRYSVDAANLRFNAGQQNALLPKPPRALPGGDYTAPTPTLVGGATSGGAPVSRPPGVPKGAVPGRDRNTGAIVWKAGSRFYDAKGRPIGAGGRPAPAALPGAAPLSAPDEDDEDEP